LILATKNWGDLTGDNHDSHVSRYLMTFSPGEIEECLELQTKLSERNSEMENIRNSIGIGSDGWLPCEEHDGAVKRNEYIKQKVIDSTEEASARALCLAHYPLDDHDEEE
jgi:hypothetical protein